MAAPEEPSYVETRTRISGMDCRSAFEKLDKTEKLYAYYFSRASWEGAKICYFQRSYESPAFFYIINKIFSLQKIEEVKSYCTQNYGYSEEDWTKLTAYLAGFLQNCGNYFSFGDKKFIPELPKDKFVGFIQGSEAYKLEPNKIDDIWKAIEHEIFAFTKPYGEIGFRDNECMSSYYSSNMTKADCKFVQDFLESVSISSLNTRVIKVNDDFFQVLVCSYVSGGKVYNYQNKKISVIYGDFSPFMMKLVQNLTEARRYAANDTQKKMLDAYIKHFNTGDINDHKESQRVWIQDKNPIIETNIGFIEVYLDPMRTRAEFEGFVAVVDKEQSKKLSNLVDNAEKIIANLTWPREFEIDKFSRPDFTSLDVLSFACSGTPVGINLPNYDDITKVEGFKNVNLGNCYPKAKKEYVLFSRDADIDLQVKHNNDSLFIIVALHELLGHGTGKLFVKDKEGKFNFDKENLKHPITGGDLTFYEHNETWGSKFGKLSSGYEECRADSVALYLSCFKESLEVLLPGQEAEWDDIVYTAWFDLALSGLKGLPYYSVETSEWGQAHICASYVILQVLIEAGNDFIKIEEAEKNGKPYLYLTLDRKQIHTTGKKAIGDFLRKQQIYKSTADVEAGSKFFNEYTKVNDTFLRYREIVKENKFPRSLELQHDVVQRENGNIEYVDFDESFEGIIKSQMFHYRGSFEDVYHVWSEHRDHFRLKL